MLKHFGYEFGHSRALFHGADVTRFHAFRKSQPDRTRHSPIRPLARPGIKPGLGRRLLPKDENQRSDHFYFGNVPDFARGRPAALKNILAHYIRWRSAIRSLARNYPPTKLPNALHLAVIALQSRVL
jgi:hypothetical protein